MGLLEGVVAAASFDATQRRLRFRLDAAAWSQSTAARLCSRRQLRFRLDAVAAQWSYPRLSVRWEECAGTLPPKGIPWIWVLWG